MLPFNCLTMATRIACVAKNNLFLLHKSFTKQLSLNLTRFLYSANALSLDGYANSREYIKNQFSSVDVTFREKMYELVSEDNSDRIIFTEDLKNILHLIEKKESDLQLLVKMITKYHSNNEIRAGSFIFGTVVMRALYYLDEPDLALTLIRDPQLDGFFEQISSYHVLMDLLFEHKRYEDVKGLYNDLQAKNINGIIHPKNPFILTIASCYKQNTRDDYDYALHTLKDFQNRGYKCPRRALEFLTALALQQNDAENALEIISLCPTKAYIDVRCLKIECYVQLKRSDKISFVFHNALQNDGAYKLTFFKDTIDKVEKFITEENFPPDSDLAEQLNKIKASDLVQLATLQDHICCEIQMIKNTKKFSFSSSNSNSNYNQKNNEADYKYGRA